MRVEILDATLDEAAGAATHYETEVPGLGNDFLAELDGAIVAAARRRPKYWASRGPPAP